MLRPPPRASAERTPAALSGPDRKGGGADKVEAYRLALRFSLNSRSVVLKEPLAGTPTAGLALHLLWNLGWIACLPQNRLAFQSVN